MELGIRVPNKHCNNTIKRVQWHSENSAFQEHNGSQE